MSFSHTKLSHRNSLGSSSIGFPFSRTVGKTTGIPSQGKPEFGSRRAMKRKYQDDSVLLKATQLASTEIPAGLADLA